MAENDEGSRIGPGREAWPGLESLPPAPPDGWAWPAIEPPPPPPPPPPEPTAPSQRRRRVLVGIGMAFAVATGAVAVLPVFVGGPAPAEQAAGTRRPASTTTKTTRPTSRTTIPPTTEPPPVPTTVPPDPPLEAAVVEISGFVSGLRGRPFLAPVGAMRLENADFDAHLRDRTRAQGEGNRLALLGLADPGGGFAERYTDESVAFTQAVYEGDTKQIVMRGKRGTSMSVEQRWMLAHELAHAYDDQHFPFDRDELHEVESEVDFGMSAAIEGNAMRVQEAWGRKHGLTLQARGGHRYGDAIEAQINGKYDYGLPLVQAAHKRGGEAAVDQLLTDPPRTSEQVMHLDKFAADEPAIRIDPPPADEPGYRAPPVGEFLLRQLLTSAVGADKAERAAAGWGGDRTIVWETDDPEDLVCQRTRYAMDTPADLDELEAAFTTWVAVGEYRSLARTGDRLDVRACSRMKWPDR